MKRIALAIMPVFLASISLKAQSDVDALRYSQSSVTGTARSIGMAGAFGALEFAFAFRCLLAESGACQTGGGDNDRGDAAKWAVHAVLLAAV